MNRNDLLARIAALVSALNEEPGGMAPASSLYLALGMDMQSYSLVSDLASQAGLVKKTSQTLTITPKGREMARKVGALMARKNPRIYTYTVTGKGSFPLDMLRYDVASPADAKSAALIKASSRRARAFFGYPEIYRYSVRLVSASEPALGRWESFGWEVSDVSSVSEEGASPELSQLTAARLARWEVAVQRRMARKPRKPRGRPMESARLGQDTGLDSSWGSEVRIYREPTGGYILLYRDPKTGQHTEDGNPHTWDSPQEIQEAVREAVQQGVFTKRTKNNPRSTGYVAAKIRAHTRAKQNSYKVTTPFGTRTEP